MKMEAGIGVTQPHAGGHLEPPEPERGSKEPPLEHLERA